MEHPVLIQAVVSVIGAILAAIPPTLYAWAALKKGKENNALAKVATSQNGEILQSTSTIHDLVNSASDKLKAEILKLQQEVLDLKLALAQSIARGDQLALLATAVDHKD